MILNQNSQPQRKAIIRGLISETLVGKDDGTSDDAEVEGEEPVAPDAGLDQVVRLLQSASDRRKLDDAVLYLQEVVGQALPRLGNRVLTQAILDQAIKWFDEA